MLNEEQLGKLEKVQGWLNKHSLKPKKKLKLTPFKERTPAGKVWFCVKAIIITIGLLSLIQITLTK